jgi:ribonuclease HI
MELSEDVVDFEKRSAIKSQVLADFNAVWTEPSSYTKGPVADRPWRMYCYGAWGSTGAGAIAILISPSGIKLRYVARRQFTRETDKCTNNIAEYEAVLLGLRKLRAMGVQCCTLKTDSKVIAGQNEKECIARDTTLERYLALVWRMENYFRGFLVKHIERVKNTKVDEMVKVAANKITLHPDVFFQILEDSLVKTVEV